MALKLGKKAEINRINFMSRLQDEEKGGGGRSGGRGGRAALPLLAALVIVLGIWGYYFISSNFVLLPQISEAQAFINSEETQSAYSRAQELELSCDLLSMQRDSISTALANTATYPRMTSELYKLIYNKCAGLVALTGLNFQRETGVVYCSGTAASAIECAQYVQRLRQTNRFISISYYGYSGSEQRYNFDITALLPGEGGEADE